MWHLLLFTLLSSLYKTKNINPKRLKYLLIAEIVFGILLGFTKDGRIVGTIGEPNALASFVVFLFPFHGNIIISLILIFLSGSRAGLIAFALELIAIFLIKRRVKVGKVFLISIFLILTSLVFPFLNKPDSPLENRAEIWRVAALSGLNKPLLGYGFGNTELAIKREAQKINSPIQNIYVDSSHNIILDWWIQGGLVGLLLFLSLTFFTIKNFIKFQKTIYLISFLGLFTTLLFNPANIVGLIELFWLIGVSFIKNQKPA